MSAPEHRSDLNARIDARRWADRGSILKTSVHFDRMQRLATVVDASSQPCQVEIQFSLDPHQQIRARLHVQGILRLSCQRCLELMDWAVDETIDFRVMQDEAQVRDDEDYLLMDEEGCLMLADVVEDELLLSVPMIPRHEHCTLAGLVAKPDDPGQFRDHASERVRPFAGLGALLSENLSEKKDT